MKCKSKQCTVFDEDKLNRRLAEIEMEEANPNLYSDIAKMKRLGTEKKSVQNILSKIEGTRAQVQDLFDLYELLSLENSTEEDWRDVRKLFFS